MFNRTDADWEVRGVSDVSGPAPDNQHWLLDALSELLSINNNNLEFGDSVTPILSATCTVQLEL